MTVTAVLSPAETPFIRDVKRASIHLTYDIGLLQESALFVKERADIERDYAKKLDFLSKKFQARKLKKMEKIRKQTATQGAETPASNLMDSFEFLSVGRGYFSSSCNYRTMETTCQHAWNALLKETEESAKSHEFLAEDLTSRVSDRLKKLASVKDEQRKKTLDFLQRYFNERRRLEENVQLSKAAYYKHCDQVQIMKQKYDRLPDVKSQEKIKKYVNLEILEMNNAKNLYLLAIQSSNSVQVKYFKEGIPEILGELRDQSVSLVEYAKSAFHEFLACRSGQHQGSLKRLEELDGKISAIDGVTDATASKQFEIRNYLDGLEPFEFDSSGLWKDSDDFFLDQQARVFLWNTMTKLQSRTAKLDSDLLVLVKGLDGLVLLQNAYAANPQQGDAEKVYDGIVSSKRDQLVLHLQQEYYKIQIDTIGEAVKDITARAHQHEFKNMSFAIPTTCDFCRQTIWGMNKPGLNCKDCSINVHVKCELKIPPMCSGVQHKRLSRTSSISRLSAMTNRTGLTGAQSRCMTPCTAGFSKGDEVRAMFDYIPHGNAVEEIDISYGDILRVIEEDDGSGWTMVSGNGKEGLVPSSYIQPICADRDENELLDKVEIPQFSDVAGSSTSTSTIDKSQRATVLFDYLEDTKEEVSVKLGDIVVVVEGDDGSGWTKVTNGIRIGLVPSSYLELK